MELATTTIQPFSDYDPLAWFYDRYWGPVSSQQLEPILEELLLMDVEPPSRVLDLCCGTGHVAAYLVQRGYEVEALDGSRAMLAYARNNAPPAEFHLADARSFQLDEPVQAALCTYESLNHLATAEDLARVFQNVFDGLEPGGRFLFDLNGAKAYGSSWQGTDGEVDDDHVVFTLNVTDPETRSATSDLTLFRYANGGWRRSDLVLTQYWYDEDEVAQALAQAGFEGVAIHDAVDDLGLALDKGRTFYVTERPE